MSDQPILQAQVWAAKCGAVFETQGLDTFPRPSIAIDDHGDGYDLGTGLSQYFDRREDAAPSRRGVFDCQDPAPSDVGALDPAAQPMLLFTLAHNERIESVAAAVCGVDHSQRYRVSSEGQSANGIKVKVRGQVQHHLTHQRSGRPIKGDAAQVDVVVGLLAGRQSDLAAHDSLVGDVYS